MVRYNKYGSIGLYARKVLWPKSFKIKLALQVVLLVIIIAQFVLSFFSTQRYILRYLQLVVQLLVWMTSLAMYRFEYKRALGHIWYMHPLLWAYTAIYYLISLVLHFYSPGVMSNINIAFLSLLGCQTVISFMLVALAIKYPQDSPHRKHNIYYEPDLNGNLLPSSSEPANDIESNSFISLSSQNHVYPRIKSKFTSQIAFDQ
jgi:hypothetical protein